MRPTRFLPFAALLTATALLAAPVTAATAVPGADARASARPTEPRDPLVPMVDVRVADFTAEAAALPPQLEQALERDAGISGAEWLAQAEASAVGVEVVDALRDHVDVRDARLDGLDLVVTVGTAAEAAVVESVGARAELGAAPGRVGDTEGLEPAADLRGGMPYLFSETIPDGPDEDLLPDGVLSFRCSVGFVGLDIVTDQPQIMSAGHCEGDAGTSRRAMTIDRPVISGGSASAPYQTIGNAGLHVTNDYPNPDYPSDDTFYDFGITPVTGAGWTPKPEIVTWGGTTSGAPLASAPLVIRDAGPALAGATLCKSGATTGWTCGAITRVDIVQYIGGGPGSCETPAEGDYCVGAVEASICVRGGDSGGAAVVGSRAVGITSAASNAGASSCAVSGNIGIFTTLYSVNPAYEQVTKVYPDWEPMIGLSAPVLALGGLNRIEGTATGSLTGASTRHDVTMTLDLGGPLTDEVNASGGWSLDLGAVPNGTRAFSLISSWGSGVQQSTPAVGRFLKAAATRLAGADRYTTSALISQYGFPGVPTASDPPAGGGVPVVYLANGATFPDALSAGPAAALEDGPLLLTPSTSLPAAITAELDRLNPAEIVIVGGASVVSPAVAAAAAAYTTGPVTRLGGANRYETSRKIAERMLDRGLAPGSNLWVATGSNFPDALSAGAAAASQGVPILLVNGTASSLDAASAAFINNELQSNRVYVAGSAGVVSEGIRVGIQGLASTGTVSREGGANRFATSWEINTAAFPGTAPEVFLAYGFNFPDALSGSVIAGRTGGPLYITQTPCVSADIMTHILDLSPSKVTVFGGTAIVSNNARDLKTC
ncbi:MAG: cell wall-binding repeat-containing protein [Microcella sp.]